MNTDAKIIPNVVAHEYILNNDVQAKVSAVVKSFLLNGQALHCVLNSKY